MATKKHPVKPAESANAIPKYDASFFVATPVPAYGISTALERETYSISGSQTTPTECQQRFFIPAKCDVSPTDPPIMPNKVRSIVST